MSANKETRNKKILKLYESGYTLQEVGDMFGITRERVGQLIREQGRFGCECPAGRVTS